MKKAPNGCYIEDGLLCMQEELEYDSDDRLKYTNGYVVLPLEDGESDSSIREKTEHMNEIMQQLKISLHHRIEENYTEEEIARNRKYPNLFFYVSCSNDSPSGNDAVRFYKNYKDSFYGKYRWTVIDEDIDF